MFQSTNRKALSEDQFETWLEKGRDSAIGFHYLLIIWNELDQEYQVQFLTERIQIFEYKPSTSEALIAAYDLYSGTRISLDV